jgi:hypothetical protein
VITDGLSIESRNENQGQHQRQLVLDKELINDENASRTKSKTNCP